MLTYLVIGICLFLLALVIFIASKPISMGIEARRNIKYNQTDENIEDQAEDYPNENYDASRRLENSISDEIIKLNQLKKDGLLTEDEYQKAKKKLLI